MWHCPATLRSVASIVRRTARDCQVLWGCRGYIRREFCTPAGSNSSVKPDWPDAAGPQAPTGEGRLRLPASGGGASGCVLRSRPAVSATLQRARQRPAHTPRRLFRVTKTRGDKQLEAACRLWTYQLGWEPETAAGMARVRAAVATLAAPCPRANSTGQHARRTSASSCFHPKIRSVAHACRSHRRCAHQPHTPPGLIPKYTTKAINCFNHSLAFTNWSISRVAANHTAEQQRHRESLAASVMTRSSAREGPNPETVLYPLSLDGRASGVTERNG